MKVSLSLIVVEQHLVRDTSCSVVWNETMQKKSNSLAQLARREFTAEPPAKRQKHKISIPEGEGSPEGRWSRHGCECVDAGDTVCCVLHTGPLLPHQEGALVVSWSEVSTEGQEFIASQELRQVRLEASAVCKGELDIDRNCLKLWQGVYGNVFHL